MVNHLPSIDNRGARGSNTGDQFHELWALQQILDLLRPDSKLKALTVEGVRSETPVSPDDNPTWDSVDCALYYGGTSLETADHVDFVQLKYSGANPEKKWSVARLTENNAKRKNNSIIRKMADDFKDAKARTKQDARFSIRLISNQELSAELRKAIDSRWTGSIDLTEIDQDTKKHLNNLKAASGLSDSEFKNFIEALDFSECGYQSRFTVRAKVVSIIADLLGNDVSAEVRELQQEVRALMLPESAGRIVTEKNILGWFGLADREGLFPCLPDIKIPEKTVKRKAAEDAVDLLKKGKRLVLVHGEGGCGKTTLMQQIANRLPEESVTVFFDCFGGGRYINTDDKRHLPENAFLHLANELSVALRLPLFIPRNIKYPADIRSFRKKLRSAGQALKKLSNQGMLLIIVDAADNSVSAAQAAEPPERSFVYDLLGANLDELPENVRFIISCRTARRDRLNLPREIAEIPCPPFSLPETREHVEISFSNPEDSLIETFHSFSYANPRVQSYAIKTAGGNINTLLETLLPNGKSLSDVLEKLFRNALKKMGGGELFQELIGFLAFLPAPVSVKALSRIAACNEDTIRDFVLDLSPGLILRENDISIADEDFEDFIMERGKPEQSRIINTIAQDFMETFQVDAYSSTHVADYLVKAGRAGDILSVIESDPNVKAISDLIARRKVQVGRLKLALAGCCEIKSTKEALKTILISADAEHDDNRINDLLKKEMDLSVEFGASSIRRLILLDPDRIADQGSCLVHDAVRAIRAGDRVTAREQLYFYDTWLNRWEHEQKKDDRNNTWIITDRDISALIETVLELDGPEAAYDDLMKWSPREIAFRVAFILVPQLIAAGKIDHIREFLTNSLIPKPWDLILWVPLAMAGEPVNGSEISDSLKRLRSRYIPTKERFSIDSGSWPNNLLDTFITACELGFTLGLDSHEIRVAVNRILKVLEDNQRKLLYRFDAIMLDGLFRCWLLRETISGHVAGADDFLAYAKTLIPEIQETPTSNGNKRKKKPGTVKSLDDRESKRLNHKIKALFPVYSARIDVLSSAQKNKEISKEQLDKLNVISAYSYEFDSDHESAYHRDKAALSVMGLMIVKNINASDLADLAEKITIGKYEDTFASHRRTVWSRMRLRVSESENLVRRVTDAVIEIKKTRAASSEKIEGLVHLSRLLLPVSRDDAESLYKDAISIAKEIDYEAFFQIDFISELAERSRISDPQQSKKIAEDIAVFVSGASAHLSGHDGFPWAAAVHAMTCVDDVTALSALSQWADVGTISLDNTLDRFILSALQRGLISPEIALFLAMIPEGIILGPNFLKELVGCVGKEPEKYKKLVDELAKDALLFSTQHSRLTTGKVIVDNITPNKNEGPWLTELRHTVDFLTKTATRDSELRERKSTVIKPRLHADLKKVESFDFDHDNTPFTTTESITKILEAAKESGLPRDNKYLLSKMREASSQLRDRIPFLNALAGIPDGMIWSTYPINAISEALDLWKGPPAVDRWCKEQLPSVLVTHFHGATQWLDEGAAELDKLLDYTGLDSDARQKIMLKGIAQSAGKIGSRPLFSLGKRLVRIMGESDKSDLLIWYAKRLRNRIQEKDQRLISSNDTVENRNEGIARFLYALMSDIDTRIRWRAAHALRRLARLGCFDIIKAVVTQSNRIRDDVFRDPECHFYFLSAKLWLAISLYRISAETPESLRACKTEIYDLATSKDFPHVGIREYAKRTLFQLSLSSEISLSDAEKEQLNPIINTAIKKHKNKKMKSLGMYAGFKREYKPQFHFDETDTIPCWYEPLCDLFPTVSLDQFLEMAERWILEKWGADPESYRWDAEKRKGRFDDRRFRLWSCSHGSRPTIELFQTYLEWNAMYCVAGELLSTHPVLNEKDSYFGSFDYWLKRVLLTDPPLWLSDNRGPTPLEERLWKNDPKTDKGWLHHVRLDEFLTEIGIKSSYRRGWIVIKGYYQIHYPDRATDIHLNTALVSPKTAPALVRAFQTASAWNIRIPNAGDELNINDTSYNLLGWVKYNENDIRFDDGDPIRYGVGQIQAEPGSILKKALGLVKDSGNNHTWICKETGEAVMIYEAWSDEPPPEYERDFRRIRTDGWRLWAKEEAVLSFLTKEGWDLICGVEINRQLKSEYRQSYETDSKRKSHEKIVLLKADGSISDFKGRVGTWTGTGRRTGT